MTAQNGCPELEALFTDLAEGQGPALVHAQGCERCKGLLEEHRQLEKDLYRLADPLPPPDLVHRVMAAVAAEPRPVGSEVRAGVGILLVAVLLAVVGFIGSGAGAGSLGSATAGVAVDGKTFLIAAGSTLSSLWQTAGLPLTFGSLLLLFVSLLGLRALATSSSLNSSEQPA